jgi:O-antigen/teichoic acid export membrane protein
MLLTIEAVTKILFRWGVDTAFIRLYYDCTELAARQRLASTLFFYLLAANGTVLAAAVLLSGWISTQIFGTVAYGLLIALTVANTFVAAFFFIPLQVLRIEQKSGQFIALTFFRSAGTIALRLALVIGAGMGVFGIVLADIVMSAVFALVLTRWSAPLIRPVFSRAVMREALGFGLPRVPHSIAHQVIGLADRYFLNAFGTLRDVGLYSIGASFGLALKLFLSAFEAAWTPFFLGLMREPDARRIYSTVSTYVVALLVLLVAGLGAIAPGVVRVFTTADFHEAAVVTPWIALGVMFQGLYLVGSIGLVIRKQTAWYPLATGTAAVVSLGANLVLIPRYGMLGAAWANALSYAVLAVVTCACSWYVYPIRYEWRRLVRIAVAGAAGFVAADRLVPSDLPLLAWIAASGVATVAVYGLVLALTGFFHAGEIRALGELRRRALPRKVVVPAPDMTQAEMAGEIVATPPEPMRLEESSPEAPPVNRDSRSPRR